MKSKASYIAFGALCLLGLALFIKPPQVLQIVFQNLHFDESGSHVVYLAFPRITSCKEDVIKGCASFEKEDSKLRLRMPNLLWNNGPEVTNGFLFLPILVTSAEIRPLNGRQSDKDASLNLIDWHGVNLGLVPSTDPSFIDKDMRISMINFLAKPALAGESFVEVSSDIQALKQFEISKCIGYETSQIDKSRPDATIHPLYDACEFRHQYFVPKEGQKAYIQCPGRLLFNGTYNTTICTVRSFFEPGLQLAYGIKYDFLSSGQWRLVDQRLRKYFQSMIVNND